MRPIKKGEWPKDSNGNKKKFASWAEAKPYLLANTGYFCHLCELKLDNTQALEHIKPKKHSHNIQYHWDNFLLICDYCNSRKTKSQIKLYDYYWPDKNNTYKVLNLTWDGIIIPNNNLNQLQLIKVKNIIELYGLDKEEDTNGGLDGRLRARLEAMSKAMNRLQEYQNNQCLIQSIIDNASSSGFWSVWFRLFKRYPRVLNELITHYYFRGTEASCFDALNNYVPQNRNPNDL